jgi:uncharacterized protein (TIGR02265 family)
MDPAWGVGYEHLELTRAYVADLPHGLASYPECRSKASIWKNILRWTDTDALSGRVPPDLTVFAAESLLDAEWMSAAQSFAAHLALRDTLFSTDAALAEHFRMLDRKLLSGRLYRMLFALTSPERVVHAADQRFRAMFAGITLEARLVRPAGVEVSLRYPPRLLPPLVGTLYLVAFEVAVELAGASGVKSRVLEHGDTSARYELSWEAR